MLENYCKMLRIQYPDQFSVEYIQFNGLKIPIFFNREYGPHISYTDLRTGLLSPYLRRIVYKILNENYIIPFVDNNLSSWTINNNVVNSCGNELSKETRYYYIKDFVNNEIVCRRLFVPDFINLLFGVIQPPMSDKVDNEKDEYDESPELPEPQEISNIDDLEQHLMSRIDELHNYMQESLRDMRKEAIEVLKTQLEPEVRNEVRYEIRNEIRNKIQSTLLKHLDQDFVEPR